ncbi:MAG TPA: response regulator [Methylomirabilota bacterium]|nr:response regulator [Methylomirabilota bacterium]
MNANFPILVLEDNPDDAFLLKRALKKNSISNPVFIVRDGVEGIEYITGAGKFGDRDAFPSPGCIVADLKMPRLGGLEFLAWLRDHPDFAVIPTLVLSSSTEDKDVAQAYSMGANSYLVKPTRFEDFEELVRIVHDYWTRCVRPQKPIKAQKQAA